jgi:hypothetical protein
MFERRKTKGKNELKDSNKDRRARDRRGNYAPLCKRHYRENNKALSKRFQRIAHPLFFKTAYEL